MPRPPTMPDAAWVGERLGALPSGYRWAVDGQLPGITAVYVSWRDTGLLLESVAQIAASRSDGNPRLPQALVVVVNEADGGEALRIQEIWPGATVILNDVNRGFGPAANQGAFASTSDALLFLNPDTSAVGDPLAAIARAFRDHPTAAAVVPALEDAGGGRGESQREFQLRRLPTIASDARELLLVDRLLPRNRWRRRDRYLDADRARPFPVEQAAAAALAVRRSAFEAVGGFDERFVPAWWEDVDLCRRLREHGDILFWPDARLRHVGGVSAGELGDARFLRAYYGNALRYRAKHYGRSARTAYRVLLVAGMLLRALVSVAPARRGAALRGSARAYLGVVRLAVSPSRREPWP